MVTQLDEAAFIAGQCFFDRFKTESRGVRNWRDDLARKLEKTLREKQIWLITPKRDTRQVLLTELSQMLKVVIEGNWDELKFSDELEINSAPPQRYRAVMFLVRAIAICVFPLSIYLFLKHFETIQIVPQFDSYIQTALILWTIVSGLAIIDPLAKDKITSVKDLLSIMAPGKK